MKHQPTLPTIEQARSWYPVSDPVHGFDHVLRVYRMAERLAKIEGADQEIVHAAVLLHDANPPQTSNEGSEATRATHHHASAEYAHQILANEGWLAERIEAVQHCIRAHRFRDDTEQPQSLEAQILFDADKLDAIGAIGVARAVAYAARAGQPGYAEPSAQFVASGLLEGDEPHSAYHEHLFKLRKIKERLYTAAAQEIAAERHAFMEQFFTRLGDEIRGEL